MSTEWTDETKKEAIKAYTDKNPTPENSSEIVAEIASSMDKTVNGVRAILVRAEVYVKKDPTSTNNKKSTTVRVNKAEAIAKLSELITNNGMELDETITSKLTGKAAIYFTSIFERLTDKEE